MNNTPDPEDWGSATITIPHKEYVALVEDSKWLSYLYAAGVDNWEGYDYALSIRDEEENNDDG